MKKLLLILASAALLFTSCAKEELNNGAASGNNITLTVNAAVPGQAQTQTKAVWDNDGNGDVVDHWIMEVYDKENKLFTRQEKENQSGLTNTFTVTLIKNQSYKFVFWADTKGAYKTESLTALEAVGNVAGKDSRDAFYCMKEYTSNTNNDVLRAQLKRPFAQLNVVTIDTKTLYETMGNDTEYGKFIPKDIRVSMKSFTKFNALNNALSGEKDVTLKIDQCYGTYAEHNEKTTIFMDYMFASEGEADVRDINCKFKSNGVEIVCPAFTNIPLQRNYRTNILGNLLSNDATWYVEILPQWNEPDYDVCLTKSIQDANNALAEGKTDIEIENPTDVTNHIIFPEAVTGKDVTIRIIGAANQTIYFENEAVTKGVTTTDGPATLTITSDVQNLNVNCPKTLVSINAGIGNTDFPVVVASKLIIKGAKGTEFKTKEKPISVNCELELADVKINTISSNTDNYGALYCTKSSSFESVTFTGASKNILVLGGTDTRMSVNNCNFDNAGKGRGIKVWGGNPVIDVNNTTFDNTYPVNVDAGSPVITVKNSTLNGWTSYSGTPAVSFEACDFGQSTSGYAFCRPYVSTSFTACDFSTDFELDFGVAGITLSLTNCTVGGAQSPTKSILTSEPQAEGILVIDGVTVYPAYTKDDQGNYHVATKDGLFTIAADMNASLDSFYGKTIYIENDIDLNNEAWTPIQGSESGDYAITFDGQNHKISNLKMTDIAEDKGAGLFGRWAGTIKNLALDGVKILNTINRSGALCGYFSTGSISDVSISNVEIANLNETKCKRNGGLCGFVDDDTQFSNVTVSNLVITGTEQLGGFIGSLQDEGSSSYSFTECSIENVSITKVGSKGVVSFGSKVGGRAATAEISGDITVSGTVTLPEGSAQDGWGSVGL